MNSVRCLFVIAVIMVSFNSNAGVILTTALNDFDGYGDATIVSDFEEFDTSAVGHAFPGAVFNQGGVSYSSSENLILGPSNPTYTVNDSNMLVDNFFLSRLSGSFTQNFTMFGFDGGWTNFDDEGTTISLSTNLSTYIFDGLDFNRADDTSFWGFVADENEFFESFSIMSSNLFALNAIDNVRVGNLSANEPVVGVPEPQTILMFLMGLCLLSVQRKTRIVN